MIGSRIICKYLEERARGEPCLERTDWREVTREAVADGIMEVNVLRLGDLMRAENLRSHGHIAAFAAKAASALDWREYRASEFSATHIGPAEAALASGLAHLDFRFPEDEWPKGRPGLTRWLQDVSTRPSFISTEFQ